MIALRPVDAARRPVLVTWPTGDVLSAGIVAAGGRAGAVGAASTSPLGWR